MKIRKLTLADVQITLTACQDDTPVRGNAEASGDDAVDRAVEDEILARLKQGDVWAWALVKVTATWHGMDGVSYLGGCCYADENDFRKNEAEGCFHDMLQDALAELNTELEIMAKWLGELEVKEGC